MAWGRVTCQSFKIVKMDHEDIDLWMVLYPSGLAWEMRLDGMMMRVVLMGTGQGSRTAADGRFLRLGDGPPLWLPPVDGSRALICSSTL